MSGENDAKVYRSSDTRERIFCATCGSNIMAALEDEPEAIYLSMSTAEGYPPRLMGYHINLGLKAPWHEITDDLRQYETEPSE